MNLLVSFDKFNEYLDLDTNKRLLTNDSHKNYGWFKYAIGGISTLFVSGNNLYLKYRNECIDVSKISECDITNMSDSVALFSVIDLYGNKISFSYEYDKTLYGVEPFDYTDEEDYDWGLFLYNIIKNPSRIKDVISNRNIIES